MGQGDAQLGYQRDRELTSFRAEVARAQDRLSDLSALGHRIALSSDLPSVLQEVVDAAGRMTEARYGALAVLDAEGTVQTLVTHGLTVEERERIGHYPHGIGLLGHIIEADGPLRLADLTQHPAAVGFPPNHPTMKTFIGCAIRDADGPLGSILLSEKAEGEEFTEEDESLLALLGGHAAAAVRHARLHELLVDEHA